MSIVDLAGPASSWIGYETTITSGGMDVTSAVDLEKSRLSYRTGTMIGQRFALQLEVLDRDALTPGDRVSVLMAGADAVGESVSSALGEYLLAAPNRTVPLGGTETVQMFGDDVTALLDQAVGATYLALAGSPAVAEAASAVAAAPGELAAAFPAASQLDALPAGVGWLLTENWTYRCICDDLLGRAAYRPTWMGRDGRATTDRHLDPVARAGVAEFAPRHWDADAGWTIVGSEPRLASDIKGWPNQWIVIRDDLPEGILETPDYVAVRNNLTVGPASQQQAGRLVRTVRRVDATSRSTLAMQADSIAANETYPTETLAVKVLPDPTLWHEDLIEFTMGALDWSRVLCEVVAWMLPLAGNEDQSVTLRRLR